MQEQQRGAVSSSSRFQTVSPVSVNNQNSKEEDAWKDMLSEHQIRGWRAVSAASLQGQRNMFSDTSNSIAFRQALDMFAFPRVDERCLQEILGFEALLRQRHPGRAGGLAGWLAAWLFDYLAAWLFGYLAACMLGGLAACMLGGLPGCLPARLPGS